MNSLGSATDSDSPPSPCINICRMNPASGLCEGCLRTLDEITQWSTASTGRKQEIWHVIKQRAQQLADAPATGDPTGRGRQ